VHQQAASRVSGPQHHRERHSRNRARPPLRGSAGWRPAICGAGLSGPPTGFKSEAGQITPRLCVSSRRMPIPVRTRHQGSFCHPASRMMNQGCTAPVPTAGPPNRMPVGPANRTVRLADRSRFCQRAMLQSVHTSPRIRGGLGRLWRRDNGRRPIGLARSPCCGAGAARPASASALAYSVDPDCGFQRALRWRAQPTRMDGWRTTRCSIQTSCARRREHPGHRPGGVGPHLAEGAPPAAIIELQRGCALAMVAYGSVPARGGKG